MSRGCINMRNEDAEWFLRRAMPGWDGDGGWLRPNEENATLVLVRD
ncbi:MAG: L,D-transpeptidase [Caldilineaceae bacterium]